MTIESRIKELTAAMDNFEEEAHDLQPGPKRQVAFNILHYMRNDFKLILHAFGIDKE